MPGPGGPGGGPGGGHGGPGGPMGGGPMGGGRGPMGGPMGGPPPMRRGFFGRRPYYRNGCMGCMGCTVPFVLGIGAVVSLIVLMISAIF